MKRVLCPGKYLLPSTVAQRMVPEYRVATHIKAMEAFVMRVIRGDFRKGVISIPIRHGKSCYLNALIGFLLISDPSLRILRVMENATVAESMALQVLKFVRDWGPKLTGCQLEPKRGGLADFMTTQGGGLKSVGMLGTAESMTYDWVIGDDCLVSPDAIRNPYRRDQAYADYKAKFLSRINPTRQTKFLYIGSRRHPTDIPGNLFRSNQGVREVREKWYYHQTPALLNEGTDHERPLWAVSDGNLEYGTVEQLHAKRDELVEDGQGWQWSCFFQNDAQASPDNLAFDPSWFTESIFYKELDPSITFNHKVLSFDPSMGEGKKENDFAAGVMQKFTRDGNRYIDDCYVQQASPDAAVNGFVELVARNQDYSLVIFEANAGGRYVEKCIRDQCQARGLRWQNIRFKTWTSGKSGLDMSDKTGRITMALWEPLSKGKIHIKNSPYARILYKQLRGFPTEHDDGPDAVATGSLVLRELLGGGM